LSERDLIASRSVRTSVRPSSIGPVPDMWEATYDIVSQVPLGRVTTYGHVARALGDIVASRFVGLAMSLNDDIVRVPCRRVVQSDGRLGGYTGGGPEKKAALLKAEGVTVTGGRVQDLDKVLFTEFVSDEPLKRLRARQRRLKSLVRVPRVDIELRYVAGVDVAYGGEHAFAAAAIFDYATGKLADSIVREGDATFPYIPTYLAFRELPLVASLTRDMPDGTVLMYDGNGMLHPEGIGIATHAGLAFHMPTIGVAKSLLCGARGRPRRTGEVPVSVGGRIAGFELKAVGASKPVYVSVGHGISPRQTLEVVRRLTEHRVPEPTRTAHMLAERARREVSHK
jgi:deoxyribonuclease V